ncbi:MAG: DUF1499 domain-containing protein [Hydrogenophaga sp.]|nr:DUF1499 domain-containing protein [Hydrogenophaga sp.]
MQQVGQHDHARQRATPGRRLGMALFVVCAAQAGVTGVAGAQTASEAAAPPDTALRLACPASPNCVNSLGVGGLAPWSFTGTAAQGLAQLRATLAGFAEAGIVADDALSITAVFTTRLGFRDEVVFVVDAARQQIHFRSRSLVGHYDFGKNRSRMRAVGERFAQTAPR